MCEYIAVLLDLSSHPNRHYSQKCFLDKDMKDGIYYGWTVDFYCVLFCSFTSDSHAAVL